MSYLRSLLITAPLIILATIVMGTLSIVASLFDSTGNSQHRLACIWGRMLLAASFIHRRMMGVQMNARRIATGDASRIQRYDAILGL